MVELTPPAGTPPAEPPAGGQPPALTPIKEPEKKTLTQAEIDDIVEERLARDRKTREEKLAVEFGMPIKDIKLVLKAKKDADEAAKTELEKLKERADALDKTLKERDLRDLKRQKIEGLIAEKKIKLPDNVSVSDVLDMVAGQDESGINEGVVKLIKFFPFVAQAGAGTNPANPAGKPPSMDEEIRLAYAEALKSGDWAKYTELCMKKQIG